MKRLCLLSSLIVASCLPACTREASTKEPPRDETPLKIAQRPSSIVVPFTIPLVALQERLQSSVPELLYQIDEGKDACIPEQYAKGCIGVSRRGRCYGKEYSFTTVPAIDCHLNGSATRGPITVTGSDNTISLSTPISVVVTARGRGEIGKNIRETATGTAIFNVSATPDIDENWNPQASVATDYSWRDRIGADILGFRVTFGSKVNPKIDEALDSVKAQVPQLLSDFQLKDKVSQIWDSSTKPIRLSASPDTWMRFTPREVGFSGINAKDGALTGALYMSGFTETFVGAEPARVAPGPLPKLIKKLPPPGFNVFVPVLADYSTIAAQAEKALEVGKTKVIVVPGLGQSKVTFEKVKVYQTNRRSLAIGVTLKVDPDGSWRDTHGTVWLVAQPQVDMNTKVLSVRNLALSSATNNEVADALVKVVNTPLIMRIIMNSVRFDFSRQWQQALVEATKSLNRDLGNGITIHGKIDTANVVDASTSSTGYFIGLEASGPVEVDIRGGSLPQ